MSKEIISIIRKLKAIPHAQQPAIPARDLRQALHKLAKPIVAPTAYLDTLEGTVFQEVQEKYLPKHNVNGYYADQWQDETYTPCVIECPSTVPGVWCYNPAYIESITGYYVLDVPNLILSDIGTYYATKGNQYVYTQYLFSKPGLGGWEGIEDRREVDADAIADAFHTAHRYAERMAEINREHSERYQLETDLIELREEYHQHNKAVREVLKQVKASTFNCNELLRYAFRQLLDKRQALQDDIVKLRFELSL